MRIPVKKIFNTFLAIIFLVGLSISSEKVLAEKPLRAKFNYGDDNIKVEYYRKIEEPYYADLLSEYKNGTYRNTASSEILIGPKDIILPDNREPVLVSNLGGNNNPSFKWSDDIPWIEWDFEIATDGLYEVALEYYMLPGTGNSATRSLKMDGIIPFFEASNIVFYRGWKDEGEPIVNSIGDEVRPGQIEIPAWRVLRICDAQGYYPQPFIFHLRSGKHTLRLEYIDQDMAIGRVCIKPVKELSTYAQVKEEYMNKGYTNANNTIEFQAENSAIEKSDPTIRRERNGDPICRPASLLDRKLNVLGGYRWRKGNQSITWEFTVPEDGLYKIAARAAQWWNDGLPSYRQIAIDGKIPFKELEEYKFVYNKKWRTEVLKDQNGEPFLFYLSKNNDSKNGRFNANYSVIER